MDSVNQKSVWAAMARKYHHGDLKSALIASALDLLDHGGADAVTVRAVARNAGVAHSAPINHFRDRAALMTAVANLVFADLIKSISRAFDEQSAPLDKLRAFGPAVCEFALAHPNRYRLLWRRESLDPDDHFIDEGVSAMCEQLKTLLLARARSGRCDVDSEVIAVWSMTHGYVALRLDGNLVDGKDLVNGKGRLVAMVEILIDGLTKPAHHHPSPSKPH
jgi:AcrR family transcriptional regulator